ncbi:MAG: DUF1499 domain-containing protein [Deltaproteobacteria bacterium HGW-Deltaproteobacteria-4]|nr:MAG: DUF1499 domain-containing protein [Deltaproteobacteria bacterium HGW-Deltaproteobacteria-4]
MTLLTAILTACAGERPKNLGVKDGVLAACPSSPNCVSSFAADEGHRITPFSFGDEPAAAFARLTQMLRQRSDATIIEEGSGYLRVELRTTLFVDDAEFLLDEENKVIHLRSASRLGYSDLGKNRSRVEEIRAAFSRGG